MRKSERMGRLCDELRIKLHGMDRRLETLKSNGAATFDQSQDVLESQLDRVEQRIYDNRVTVEAANVRVKAWLAEKRAGSGAGVDLWTERNKALSLASSYPIRPSILYADYAKNGTRGLFQHWVMGRLFLDADNIGGPRAQ